MKQYDVQFRVVAIVEIKIKATDMQDALEAAKGYDISKFIDLKTPVTIHDSSVKVVGVDDDWGDVS